VDVKQVDESNVKDGGLLAGSMRDLVDDSGKYEGILKETAVELPGCDGKDGLLPIGSPGEMKLDLEPTTGLVTPPTDLLTSLSADPSTNTSTDPSTAVLTNLFTIASITPSTTASTITSTSVSTNPSIDHQLDDKYLNS